MNLSTVTDRHFSRGLSRLRAFHRDPLAFFWRLTGGQPARVRFKMGPWTFYLLNDPDSVHFVLAHHMKHFRKGPGLERDNPLIGAGLLTDEEAAWAEQRRRLAPVFRPDNVAAMVPWLDRTIEEFMGRLIKGQPFDLEPAMLELSLTMAARTIFADDVIDPGGIRRIGADVEWLMSHFYHRSRSVWRFPYGIPVFNRRYHRHAGQLRHEAHRLTPALRPFDTVWPHLASDASQRDQELLTLVVAGYETTGHALAWAIHLLSRHPEHATKVYEESLTDAVPDETTHPYTMQVVRETLRLYPPVWLLSRRPADSVTVEDIHMTPSDIILISPWLTQRTAAWFESPDRFIPGRFSEPMPPYTYIPFGGGPRGCIGEHLALKESVLALSRLMRQMVFHAESTPDVFPGLTLKASQPLWTTASPR